MKYCIWSEAKWALVDPELQLRTSVSQMEKSGRDMNRPGRASCSVTSGGAKSLSLALFWSQSHAPYMVRAVVTIVAGFSCRGQGTLPSGTDIAGLGHVIYILVL